MSSTFKRSRKLISGTTTTPKDTKISPETTAESDNTTPAPDVSITSHITTNHHIPMNGTKFWTHGIVLTSTGLRELDNILLSSFGNNASSSSSSNNSSIGGQPIGTCICLETDDRFLSWSSPLSNCIVRYWCAEGIAQDQALVIPIFNERNLAPLHDIVGEIPVPPWSGTDNVESLLNENAIDSNTISNMDAIQELLDSLPRNNNLDVQQRSELLSMNKSSVSSDVVLNPSEARNVPLETLAEEGLYEHEGDDDDEDYYNEKDEDSTNQTKLSDPEAGLVVAWQYRKDIQDERMGFTHVRPNLDKKRNQQIHSSSASVYCHSYNLQGRLKDQLNIVSHLTMVPISTIDLSKSSNDNSRIRNGMKFYQQLISIITKTTRKSSSSRNTAVRLLLYHPDMSLTSFALPLLLHNIRKFKLPVIVMVIPHSLSSTASDKSDLFHIRRCSDVVMSTESFSLRDTSNYPPPSEFRNLHGLLHISRLFTMTQMCTVGHFAERTIQRTPISTRYGLYRDRRKLNISLLHIPPEDYSADGGSVTSGAVRSGAGRTNKTANTNSGCSSSGDNGTGPLDF